MIIKNCKEDKSHDKILIEGYKIINDNSNSPMPPYEKLYLTPKEVENDFRDYLEPLKIINIKSEEEYEKFRNKMEESNHIVAQWVYLDFESTYGIYGCFILLVKEGDPEFNEYVITEKEMFSIHKYTINLSYSFKS